MSEIIVTRTSTPDELYHYGVLGMKWGVRRYHNKDGSLNSAGKKKAIKRLNESQRTKDIHYLVKKYDRKHKTATAIKKGFVGGVSAGVAAGHIAMAIATQGASIPLSAVSGSALAGMAYLSSSKHANKVMSKTIKELDRSGVNVSERPTEFSYTFNGMNYGTRKTKRYNSEGATSPYKENHTYDVI